MRLKKTILRHTPVIVADGPELVNILALHGNEWVYLSRNAKCSLSKKRGGGAKLA